MGTYSTSGSVACLQVWIWGNWIFYSLIARLNVLDYICRSNDTDNRLGLVCLRGTGEDAQGEFRKASVELLATKLGGRRNLK